MWDPLLNDFPETVHGFRAMLAVKYLLHLEQEYDRGTVGAEYIRDLIGVLRCKSYVEATRRYNNLNTRLNFDSPYTNRVVAPTVRVTRKRKIWANRPMYRKPKMYRMYRSPDVPKGCEGPCKVQSYEQRDDVKHTGMVRCVK
uniref:Protein V2 n=2 Tax=Begomovirus TaxID=10814 RepID=A0A2R3Z0B1_9GEMI|nr:AV2 [East African cassava mosaic Malawi virus]AVR43700.1 AV2 [East African cassava mosaic Cameroon virus]